MSRKHNTKHPDRGRSNYGRRLEARGLSHAPVMADVIYLRRKQTREAAEQESGLRPAEATETTQEID